ncbi:MAG: hypothetical protein H6Q48_2880, partial [Deltaproteobacteria bacterium]|nr:hypothetical protein [Deltaproteobacteria bacterium]
MMGGAPTGQGVRAGQERQRNNVAGNGLFVSVVVFRHSLKNRIWFFHISAKGSVLITPTNLRVRSFLECLDSGFLTNDGGSRFLRDWEGKREAGPVPQDALHLNLAAMLSYDPLCNGQTKPRSLRLGGEKWLEDAIEIRSGNPHPLIFNHELDCTPVAIRREPNLPSLRRRLERIMKQVDQDLPDLLRIQACPCSAFTLADEMNSAVSELIMQHPL